MMSSTQVSTIARSQDRVVTFTYGATQPTRSASTEWARAATPGHLWDTAAATDSTEWAKTPGHLWDTAAA